MPLFLKLPLLIIGGLLLLGAGAYRYYVYAPVPGEPALSAAVRRATMRVGGRERSYLAYVPARQPTALVLVLHGSGSDGTQMRQWTGYEFDELADRLGLIVLYPDGYKGNWNDCRRDAPFAAKKENIDDVGFMRALVAHYQAAYPLNPRQVYAFGYSNGGQLAFRLAIEEPRLVRAVAAAGANLPTRGTCSCALEGPTTRVLLVSGTQDPISPYGGGEVTLFGLSSRGMSISAQATAAEFARRAGATGPPTVTQLPHQRADDPTLVECRTWQQGPTPLVALYTVQGGGHVVPQPRFRFGHLLGRTTGDLDMPAAALEFFGLMK